MITSSATEFLDAFRQLEPVPDAATTARAVFLVAPAAFSLAAESASDNVYMAMDQHADPAAPDAIAKAYDGHVVHLDAAQKQAFAANAITLCDERVWMSARAASSLSKAQREALAGYGFAIGSVDLAEIEKAGGSLRCCVGEIF